MPTSSSAKKRLRQTKKLTLRNRAVKSSVRNQVRKVRDAVAAGNLKDSQTELQVAARKLDKAATKGVIHRNTAARTKSRLAHLVKSLSAKAK